MNIRMKTLAGDKSTGTNISNKTIIAIQRSDTEPSNTVKSNTNFLISTDDSENPVYMWFEDGTIKWWSEAKTVNAGASLQNLCHGIRTLTDISGLSSWKTDNVTDMNGIFQECCELIDLSPLAN